MNIEQFRIKYAKREDGKYLITPEIAKELLKNNFQNRTLKPKVVEKYSRDMKNGTWHCSGETIKIDENGKLIDGQHRLHACVDAECSFSSFVVFDIPSEAQKVIDQGVPRRLADNLKIEGIQNSGLVSQTARLLTLHIKGKIEPGLVGSFPVSDEEIRFTLASHPELTDFIQVAEDRKWFCSRYLTQFMGKPLSMFLFYVFSGIDPEKSINFFEEVFIGDMISSEGIAFNLRERLSAPFLRSKTQSRLPTLDKIAIVMKAWRMYTGEDEAVPNSPKGWNAKLRWTRKDTQPFPVLENDPFRT